jgi:hypothetical protein
MIIGGVAGIVGLVLAVGLTVFVVMRRKNSSGGGSNGRDNPPTPRPLPFPNTPVLGQQHAPPPASIMLPPNNGIGRFGRYNRSVGGVNGMPGSPPSGGGGGGGGGGGLSLPAGAMRPAGSLQLPPGIASGAGVGPSSPPGASGMANLTRINPQVRHLENA